MICGGFAADHLELLLKGNGRRTELELVVSLDQLPILRAYVGFRRFVVKDDNIADLLSQLLFQVFHLCFLLKIVEALVQED